MAKQGDIETSATHEKCWELNTKKTKETKMKRRFCELEIGARFEFRGRRYEKMNSEIGRDEERGGNVFHGTTEVVVEMQSAEGRMQSGRAQLEMQNAECKMQNRRPEVVRRGPLPCPRVRSGGAVKGLTVLPGQNAAAAKKLAALPGGETARCGERALPMENEWIASMEMTARERRAERGLRPYGRSSG